ncbi:hypothetical protein Sjap_016849 [Stephania japonica]|uniref:Uncharacterized protein n=1 Tax=Stephania japonica TaxID=461633 RepID=A0AAP0NJ55_9MAGN
MVWIPRDVPFKGFVEGIDAPHSQGGSRGTPIARGVGIGIATGPVACWCAIIILKNSLLSRFKSSSLDHHPIPLLSKKHTTRAKTEVGEKREMKETE